MPSSRAVPVIIGVGDVKNKSSRIEGAIEPMQLMLQAILQAIEDTGLSDCEQDKLRSQIDSIHVVPTWTWKYPDLPGLLGEKLGVKPQHKRLGPHGGHSPALLVDHAARRISNRRSKVTVVTGAEALASLSASMAAKIMPPPGWTKGEPNMPFVSQSDLSKRGQNIGTHHLVGLPIHVYPLYENAFRAYRGQSLEENDEESAQLYADFAKVAEKNPYAWSHGQPAASKEAIRTLSKSNRMICFPYRLLMNAFNTVNLAACCILTSTEYAAKLGISESRWIYPLSGAGTSDSAEFWLRPNYYSSPSMERSLDAALQLANLDKDQIDLFDFYSCFPIVPKLACRHLDMSYLNPPKPITLLGGLTSFGGAGNNYSMHAITQMTRELRKGEKQYGLVLANGGVVTHQHVLILSNRSRQDASPYPGQNILPELITDVPVPRVIERAEGEATVETYTVEFARDGKPLRGYVVGRLSLNDQRFVANHADESNLLEMSNSTKEQVGRKGYEISRHFALAKARVIMINRKEEHGHEAMEKIKKENPNAKIEWEPCDFGNLKEVKEVFNGIRDAGINANTFGEDHDGIDRHFGVNWLGQFYAVNLLYLLLRKTSRMPDTPAPRIVIESSENHRMAPNNVHFGSVRELNNATHDPTELYGRSKLAIILGVKYGFVERVIKKNGDNIYALSVHPGIVNTDMQAQWQSAYPGLFGKVIQYSMEFLGRSPEQGSYSALYAATSPEVEEKNMNGYYLIDPGQEGKETSQASDPVLGAALWDLSERLVKEKVEPDALESWDA